MPPVLLADYQSRTVERMMANLADAIQPIQEGDAAGSIWRHESSKARLFATLKERADAKPASAGPTAVSVLAKAAVIPRWNRMLWCLSAAAVLFVVVLAGIISLATKKERIQLVPQSAYSDVRASNMRNWLRNVERWNAQIAADSKAPETIFTRFWRRPAGSEEISAEVKSQKAALDEKAKQLALQNQEQSGGLAYLCPRSAINSRAKLEDAEKLSFTVAQDELNGLRTERQKKICCAPRTWKPRSTQLSRDRQEQDQTVRQQEQFLVADRDIREMMGARQLYIADVFDVDREGQTRQPFGRVFTMTKGKSLVFYAFDLDRRSGYHDAKAFQAWGRQGQDGSQPDRPLVCSIWITRRTGAGSSSLTIPKY